MRRRLLARCFDRLIARFLELFLLKGGENWDIAGRESLHLLPLMGKDNGMMLLEEDPMLLEDDSNEVAGR